MGNLCSRTASDTAPSKPPHSGTAPQHGAKGEEEEDWAHTAQSFQSRASPAAAWLKELGLQQYVAGFQAAGYSDWELLGLLQEKDLQMIELHGNMVILPGHRKKLLLASRQMGQPLANHPARRRLRATKSFELRNAAQHVMHPSRVTPLHSVCTPRTMSATSYSSANPLSRELLEPLPGGTTISRQSSLSTFRALSALLKLQNPSMSALKLSSSAQSSPTASLQGREHANAVLGFPATPHSTSKLNHLAGDSSPRAVPQIGALKADLSRPGSASSSVSNSQANLAAVVSRLQTESRMASKRQIHRHLSHSLGSQGSGAGNQLLTHAGNAPNNGKQIGEVGAHSVPTRAPQCWTDGGAGPTGAELRPAHPLLPQPFNNRFLLGSGSPKRPSAADGCISSKTSAASLCASADTNRPSNSQSRLRPLDTEPAARGGSVASSPANSEQLCKLSHQGWLQHQGWRPPGSMHESTRPPLSLPATTNTQVTPTHSPRAPADPVSVSPTWAAHRSQQNQPTAAPGTQMSPARMATSPRSSATVGAHAADAAGQPNTSYFAVVTLSEGMAPDLGQPAVVPAAAASSVASPTRPYSAPVRHMSTQLPGSAALPSEGRQPALYALSHGSEVTDSIQGRQLPGSYTGAVVGDMDERALKRSNLKLVKALMEDLADTSGCTNDSVAQEQGAAAVAQQRKALLLQLRGLLSQLLEVTGGARGASVIEKTAQLPGRTTAGLGQDSMDAAVATSAAPTQQQASSGAGQPLLSSEWQQLHQLHTELEAKIKSIRPGDATQQGESMEFGLRRVVSASEGRSKANANGHSSQQPPRAGQLGHGSTAVKPTGSTTSDPLAALSQVEASVRAHLARLAELMEEDGPTAAKPLSTAWNHQKLPPAAHAVAAPMAAGVVEAGLQQGADAGQACEGGCDPLHAAVQVLHARKQAQTKKEGKIKNRLSSCVEEADGRDGSGVESSASSGGPGRGMHAAVLGHDGSAPAAAGGAITTLDIHMGRHAPGQQHRIHQELQALEQNIQEKIRGIGNI